MRTLIRISKFIWLAASTTFYSTAAFPQSCPEVEVPAVVQQDDLECLAALEQRFSQFSDFDIALLPVRNALLTDFAFANQRYVIDTMFTRFCQLLHEPRFALAPAQRDVELLQARDTLYQRVPFPPPLLDTRNISAIEAIQNQSLFASQTVEQPVFLNTLGPPAAVPPQHKEALSGANSEYLKAPPFWITEANKYFVVVASVQGLESAINEARRLKRKAPEFDYQVYAPYGDNRYHAIMVATWLSREQARQVEAMAQEKVNNSSYIWRCPGSGDKC